MRLLYIVQYFTFPENPGGSRAYDLATSFANRGIEVTVITTDPTAQATRKWTRIEREGIVVYRLRCEYRNELSFKCRIRSFLKFARCVFFKGLSINFDCILATSTPLTTGIPAKLLSKFKKKPFVFEVRDVWPSAPIGMGIINNRVLKKLLYSLELSIYRSASHIVPLSIGMKEDIETRYPNNKSTVITNISNLTRFSNVAGSLPLDLPNMPKILLYAGTFGRVNGVDYIVHLAEQTLVLDRGICFVLIGKGSEKQKVVQLAKEKKVLGQNVFIFDPIPKNDLPALYAHITVGSSFVIDIPVLWENSANKFFDTLASGHPIVINHLGWQADTIKKYNIGYVLPTEINATTAQEFVDYMNNDKLLIEQGINGRELAIREYSLNVAVERYMSIFTNLIIGSV